VAVQKALYFVPFVRPSTVNLVAFTTVPVVSVLEALTLLEDTPLALFASSPRYTCVAVGLMLLLVA